MFTPEDDQYIREHYPSGTASDIADYFGVSGAVITRRAKELGLQKDKDWSKAKFQKRYVKDYKYGNYVPYVKYKA